MAEAPPILTCANCAVLTDEIQTAASVIGALQTQIAARDQQIQIWTKERAEQKDEIITLVRSQADNSENFKQNLMKVHGMLKELSAELEKKDGEIIRLQEHIKSLGSEVPEVEETSTPQPPKAPLPTLVPPMVDIPADLVLEHRVKAMLSTAHAQLASIDFGPLSSDSPTRDDLLKGSRTVPGLFKSLVLATEAAENSRSTVGRILSDLSKFISPKTEKSEQDEDEKSEMDQLKKKCDGLTEKSQKLEKTVQSLLLEKFNVQQECKKLEEKVSELTSENEKLKTSPVDEGPDFLTARTRLFRSLSGKSNLPPPPLKSLAVQSTPKGSPRSSSPPRVIDPSSPQDFAPMLRQISEDLRTQLDQSICDKYQSLVSSLEMRVEELTKDVNEANKERARLKRVEKQLEDSEKRCEELQRQTEVAKARAAEVDSLFDAFDAMKRDVEVHGEGLNAFNTDLAATKEQLTRVSTHLLTIGNVLATIQSFAALKVSTASPSIAPQLRDVEAQNQLLAALITKFDEIAKNCVKEVKKAESTLQSLIVMETNRRLVKALEDVERRVKAANERAERAEMVVKMKEDDIGALVRERNFVEMEWSKQELKAMEMDDALRSLRAKLEEAERRIQRAEDETQTARISLQAANEARSQTQTLRRPASVFPPNPPPSVLSSLKSAALSAASTPRASSVSPSRFESVPPRTPSGANQSQSANPTTPRQQQKPLARTPSQGSFSSVTSKSQRSVSPAPNFVDARRASSSPVPSGSNRLENSFLSASSAALVSRILGSIEPPPQTDPLSTPTKQTPDHIPSSLNGGAIPGGLSPRTPTARKLALAVTSVTKMQKAAPTTKKATPKR